jgi:hypothetical protein
MTLLRAFAIVESLMSPSMSMLVASLCSTERIARSFILLWPTEFLYFVVVVVVAAAAAAICNL